MNININMKETETDVGNEFRCPICRKIWMSKAAILDHIKQDHGLCKICGAAFRHKETMEKHILEYHGNQRRPIKKKKKRVMRSPKKLANPNQPEVINQDQLAVEIMDVVGFFRCEICDQVLPSQQFLYQHIRSIHGIDPTSYIPSRPTEGEEEREELACRFCRRIWMTKSGLAAHIRTDHGPCDFCDRTFRYKDNLKRHMRESHNKKMRNKKPAAAALTNSPNDGTKQKQIVTMVSSPPAMGTWGGYSPNANDNKKLKCDMCERELLSQAFLNYHKRKIHGVEIPPLAKNLVRKAETFKCYTCGRIFKDKNNLKQHQTLHESPKSQVGLHLLSQAVQHSNSNKNGTGSSEQPASSHQYATRRKRSGH